MRKLLLITFVAVHCTSGSDYDARNKDIFDEAKSLSFAPFTTTPIDFTGATPISTLRATLEALAASNSATVDNDITDVTIEGIVTTPSSYGFNRGADGCDNSRVYQSSFVLQDSTAGILVAYGQDPPSQNTADINSMRYITNARNPKMAVFGDRIRLTATHGLFYGGANAIAIVTDFTNVQVISSRNSVPYSVQTAAFARPGDLYQVRRVEGYVKTQPKYVECGTGTRSFQFDFQKGYLGILCVGATSATDATNCTGGSKLPIKFQMSLYLGAGTLSGFDVGDMYSYNISQGAKVRMTGAVFPPQMGAATNSATEGDGNFSIMLGQRLQVETIK